MSEHTSTDPQDTPEVDAEDTPQKPLRFAEQVEALEAELAAANEKAEHNWDKAVRAVAELENTRKRAEKDVQDAYKYSIERFAKALLPILDSLEQALAIEATPESEAIKTGIELTHKMFLDTLEKFNLSKIHPLGEAFDPEHHEAMSMIPAEDAESNTIIQVFQAGYLLNGRLVRPARVIVAQ